MDFGNLKFLVVGSGFFGAVIAERIANDLGERVVILEKRDHLGGNCFSLLESETGIEYHQYGTHIFHTSRPLVWEYINKFNELNSYRHQVLSTYKNKVYQMPINLETINSFYGTNLLPFEAKKFLMEEAAKEGGGEPKNFEEKAIAAIGRRLYEAFIRGYTIKQWQKDPKDLPSEIFSRIPVRFNYDESYYFDLWQGIPKDGYGQLFEKMLNNPKIEVVLKTDYCSVKNLVPKECQVIYTGPLDRLFDYQFGKLEWRSLKFTKKVHAVEDFQGTAVMNFPEEDVPFIRSHEPRHLHPERAYTKEKTVIWQESSLATDSDNEPYYPLLVAENKILQDRYLAKAKEPSNLIWGGRLADYKYYDMDETIAAALELYERRIKGCQQQGAF